MPDLFNSSEYVKCLLELHTRQYERSGIVYGTINFASINQLFSTLCNHDNYSTMNSWIKMEPRCFSLECLWELQRLNILEFTTYIYHNIHFIPSLSDKFDELMWFENEAEREYSAEVLGALLVVLINLGAHSHRDICAAGQKLLTSIKDKFVEKLLGSLTSEPVPFLSVLGRVPSCAASRLRVFSWSLLQAIVQHTPETVSLEEAISNQAMLYTSSKSPPAIKHVLKEIITNTTEESIINELNAMITSKELFNWRWLLTFVSVFVEHFCKGAELLKECVNAWLSQACDTKDSTLLAAALLCARQACAENSQKFSTYSTWFGGLQVRPASCFIFFFNFLSELVPFEPVLCLKIHVNKIPSTPPNCHAAVADYAALVKTRLADLNQTTDYVGLFGEYTTTEQEGREADVAKVINHYKQNKEVMKIVLEASVFRRQFYEKVFLAELLKEVNPQHKEFIEKLYSIGKIPHGLYSKWKLNC